MATQATNPPKAVKTPKEQVKLCERIKNQLNAAVLRGKVSVDELSDLQAHITKVSGLLA